MKENILEMIPVRSDTLKWETDEQQLVTLLVENKGLANKVAQIFFKKPKVSQVHMDKMGSLVWQNIDGVRTAGELAEGLDTSYEQMAVYLKLLEKQKFVKFKKEQ